MGIALHYRAYSPTDLPWIVRKVFMGQEVIRTNKKVAYYNVPLSFDIETTSFKEGDAKRATMYAWMLGIGGYCVMGRTWKEYFKCLDNLCELLGVNIDKRIILYVHNLSFEFQFIKDRHVWDKVFALDERNPCYCVTTKGVEYRCSYILSGYSLAGVARNLVDYDIRKLVGDLDYSKMRHSSTPLTEEEIAYCVNDVMIVNAYIQERINADGDITKIPLTKTGYVRNYCKGECLGTGRKRVSEYSKTMKVLTLETEEYQTLRRAFQGGFTHGNAMWVGRHLHDIDAYDFTSSYPSVMVAELYPMGKGERITVDCKETFERCLDCYCCVFDVEFFGLRCVYPYEEYISSYHCEGLVSPVVNNGRLVECKHCVTTVTDVDWAIISKMYEWDDAKVDVVWRYRRGYLPTEFVHSVLELYKDKTELKGVDGREADYMHRKEMLNSCYGMAVTDLYRPECTYENGGWKSTAPDLDESISKYNKARRRFLFYPWGVWVTAYARRNLFTGILSVGSDYVYCDTDSLKILHGERHREYFEQYNKNVIDKLNDAMRWHDMNGSMISPLTVKGIPKPLGVWDYEGHYSDFKTLGAKRYLYTEEGRNHLTVAGLNKMVAMRYMESVTVDCNSLYEFFSDGMYIPRGESGKSTHTYIDTPSYGELTDYCGNTCNYSELSSLHLEESDYSMGLSNEFLDYLRGAKWMKVGK